MISIVIPTFNESQNIVPLIKNLIVLISNFEYENTIRDLIGFHLDLNDNLPDDPEKPYRFNNTAEFMLLGSGTDGQIPGKCQTSNGECHC